MTANHGNIHKYLGITIDYKTKGMYKITMFNYIKETLKTFENIDPKATGTKLSVDPTKLFVMRDDCKNIKTKVVNSYTR